MDSALGRDKGFLNIFHSPFTAWIILVCSLVLTVAAYVIANHFVERRALDRFEYRVEKITSDIQDRMHVYEQVLWGAVGLFNATDEVTREGFRKYVDTLKINVHWPGIQGIGFSVPVSPQQKDAHVQRIRKEGFLDYKINPPGTRESYTAIIYLEPFDWRNQRAFGYDMWSNETRQEAMMRARDEGSAATSGIITLVQETDQNIQKGFLTYLPVFKTGVVPDTVQGRRDVLAGWVYSAFRAGDLMQGIIGRDDNDIEFEIYDGPNVTREALLYDSDNRIHLDQSGRMRGHTRTVELILQGRPWTVYFSQPENILSDPERNQPIIIALGGVIVDILLFYVIWSIYFLQRRASGMAKQMTKDMDAKTQELEKIKLGLQQTILKRTHELEKARSELEKRVQKRTLELEERMFELETMNEAMVGRELKMEELQRENDDLRKKLNGK